MTCKCKGGWKNGGFIMYKLYGWLEKGGHCDVEMKGWM